MILLKQACKQIKRRTKTIIKLTKSLQFGFILNYTITKMKEKMKGMQRVEKMSWIMWKGLWTAALLYALWSPVEWYAQDLKSADEGVITTDVVSPQMEEKKVDTIDWVTAIQWTWVKDRDDWISEWDDGKKKLWVTWWDWDGDDTPDTGWDQGWEKEWSRIWVHGFVQVWTSVVPDFASIFSDKVSWMIGIDAKDSKTWLWLTVIRLDDFHKDPEYPLSKASVVVPYWTISAKDGKRSAWASVEFSFIDQMPETIGVTPVVVWTYSQDWWTFEWKYFHDIVKWWKDMDAFRLWITKKIWDILSLTAQWWYKSDYDGKFYGRVIADVDLWGGFWAQLSCIAKDGKLTPTGWVIYRF